MLTIVFNVHRSLSVNFRFRSVFLFVDDCFVCVFMIVDTVAHETFRLVSTNDFRPFEILEITNGLKKKQSTKKKAYNALKYNLQDLTRQQ